MYKRMIIQFAGIDDCEVELVDHPITQLSCDLHKMNAEKCGYWIRKSSIISHHNIIESQYEEVYHDAPIKINKEIDRIYELTGFDWPVRAYSGMDFPECNLIHRMFTTGRGTMKMSVISNRSRDAMFDYKRTYKPAENWWRMHIMDEEFLATPQYPLDMSDDMYKEVQECLETINAQVHRYEDVCLVSGRSNMLYNKWGGARLHEIFDVAWDERDHNGWLVNEAIKAYPHQEPHKKAIFGHNADYDITSDLLSSYQTDPDIDVYGLKNIIGKSYMLAWNQYDDPRYWDIARTQTISGGFTLDPHGITNQFYNSDYFLNWLDEYNHPHDPQLYGHVPIGSITNGWGKPQMEKNYPYMVFKNESECETEMMSETHRICDDWQVTGVIFE